MVLFQNLAARHISSAYEFRFIIVKFAVENNNDELYSLRTNLLERSDICFAHESSGLAGTDSCLPKNYKNKMSIIEHWQYYGTQLICGINVSSIISVSSFVSLSSGMIACTVLESGPRAKIDERTCMRAHKRSMRASVSVTLHTYKHFWILLTVLRKSVQKMCSSQDYGSLTNTKCLYLPHIRQNKPHIHQQYSSTQAMRAVINRYVIVTDKRIALTRMNLHLTCIHIPT